MVAHPGMVFQLAKGQGLDFLGAEEGPALAVVSMVGSQFEGQFAAALMVKVRPCGRGTDFLQVSAAADAVDVLGGRRSVAGHEVGFGPEKEAVGEADEGPVDAGAGPVRVVHHRRPDAVHGLEGIHELSDLETDRQPLVVIEDEVETHVREVVAVFQDGFREALVLDRFSGGIRFPVVLGHLLIDVLRGLELSPAVHERAGISHFSQFCVPALVHQADAREFHAAAAGKQFAAVGRKTPAVFLGEELVEFTGEKVRKTFVQIPAVLVFEPVHAGDHLRPFVGFPAGPVGIHLGHDGGDRRLVYAPLVHRPIFLETGYERFGFLKVGNDEFIVLHDALGLLGNFIVVTFRDILVCHVRYTQTVIPVAIGNQEMVVGPQKIGLAQGTGLDFGERLLLLLFQQADDHPVAAVHSSSVICAITGIEGIDQPPFIPGGGHGGQGGDIAGFAEYEVIHASLLPVHVPAQ